jgi:hypothetical protein
MKPSLLPSHRPLRNLYSPITDLTVMICWFNISLENFFTQKLVEGIGSDFDFADRGGSLQILADCVADKLKNWTEKKHDRNLHPIPFVADGPGSGKSRFLQELPTSFRSFVKNSSRYSKEVKEIMENALYINVTFGNGTVYKATEIECGIEESICLRILYQVDSLEKRFDSYVAAYKSEHVRIFNVLDKLVSETGYSCIVLGIDEVNKVYELDKDQFSALYKYIGGLSCSSVPPYLVPVFAGTVIGPMTSMVTKSMHPPLHIPLPLLSFESSLDIIRKKSPQIKRILECNNGHYVRQLIADVGGHCRSLEILYEVLKKFESQLSSDDFKEWDFIMRSTCSNILSRYPQIITEHAFGYAIAYSLLALPVDNQQVVEKSVSSLTFRGLEELGLIKLEFRSDRGYDVKVPFVFVYCYVNHSTHASHISKFWYQILISRDFWWQDWEIFNRDYIAFRLSLFAFLKRPTIPLSEFFAGAKMNLPVDHNVKIPKVEDIKVVNLKKRYPETENISFQFGTSYLNSPGAAFDSFMYLQTESNGPIMLAFQMKLSNPKSQVPLVINDSLIRTEYKKIKNVVDTRIPDTYFLCIILGRCEGKFKEDIPDNCVIVSKEEQKSFYGESYYQRLNIFQNE